MAQQDEDNKGAAEEAAVLANIQQQIEQTGRININDIVAGPYVQKPEIVDHLALCAD